MKFEAHLLLTKASFYSEKSPNRQVGAITECHQANDQATAGKHGLYPLAYDHGNPCFCWRINLETGLKVWVSESCSGRGLAYHPGVVTFMFLLFQECSQRKKTSLPYKSVKENFLQQRFCFHNLSLPEKDLIACSTGRVTEALSPTSLGW